MLARMGQKVLILDWDLEAPGLERFFGARVYGSRHDTPGLVDLITGFRTGENLNWRSCRLKTPIPQGETIHIIHAGRDDERYLDNLNAIDWGELFKAGFGRYLEDMRTEWTTEYNYVLIDSRTGITDVGGICSILLPDYLLSMFTTTEQSLLGVKGTMIKASRSQAHLPLDRRRLMIIPIAARDESGREYERAAQWRKRFAQELAEFYEDWIDKRETAESILDYLKIPYVPFWSFGESLPVLEEDATNPKTLAYSYALMARLLHGRLDWSEVKEGRKAAAATVELAAETQSRRAEAEKIRLEAQAKQNAEATQNFEKRQELVEYKYQFLANETQNKIKTSTTTSLVSVVIFVFSCAVIYGAAIAFGRVEDYSIDRDCVESILAVSILIAIGSAVTGIVWLVKLLLSRRRNRILAKEKDGYEIGLGIYSGLSSDAALLLFAERIERIAASVWSRDRMKEIQPSAPTSKSHYPRAQTPDASRPSQAAPLQPPAGSAAQEEAKLEEEAPIDVYLAYSPAGIVPAWVAEFKPLFESWLGEALGRRPIVFDSCLATAKGEALSSAAQDRALKAARTAVLVLTRRVVGSLQAGDHLSNILDRSSNLALFPIILDKIPVNYLPLPLANIQSADFGDLAYIGEGFSRSERYIDFQDRVRNLAEAAKGGRGDRTFQYRCASALNGPACGTPRYFDCSGVISVSLAARRPSRRDAWAACRAAFRTCRAW
jgi:hypothetical protein